MSRFGKISPHRKKIQSLWAFFGMVYAVFGKRLYPTLAIFYAAGTMFFVVNDRRLKNNLVIWSH